MRSPRGGKAPQAGRFNESRKPRTRASQLGAVGRQPSASAMGTCWPHERRRWPVGTTSILPNGRRRPRSGRRSPPRFSVDGSRLPPLADILNPPPARPLPRKAGRTRMPGVGARTATNPPHRISGESLAGLTSQSARFPRVKTQPRSWSHRARGVQPRVRRCGSTWATRQAIPSSSELGAVLAQATRLNHLRRECPTGGGWHERRWGGLLPCPFRHRS